MSSELDKKYRVQLDFPAAAFEELEALKKATGAATRANTVRYAMQVLQWVISQTSDGAKILVEKDGKLSGVVFPFFSVSSQQAPRINLRALEKEAQRQEPDKILKIANSLIKIGHKDEAEALVNQWVTGFRKAGRGTEAEDLETRYAEVAQKYSSVREAQLQER